MTALTLQSALDNFLQVDRRPQTREAYRKTLTPFVRAIGPARPLELVSPEDLDAYVTALRQRQVLYEDHPLRPVEHRPLSAATVAKHVKTIKTFFNWCVARGYIEQSPARYLLNRRREMRLGQGKAATDAEVELLLAAARFRPRERAIVLLLAKSGCRAGELAALRIGDLNLEEHTAFVDGKGGIRRKIYFDAETSAALSDWLAVRPRASHDLVFCSRLNGGPLSAPAVSQIVRRLCRVAGIRSLGAHSLRHRVGLKFARNRVAPRVAQAYLGHRDLTITLSYYQDVDEGDLFAAGSLL